ncbi:hypothetical protein EDB86DRAFT_3240147 [Lactarius hatsudake]|nr:hypothetical protein EDB86DRAFT_2827834 [Lactarius hatsudake]KAH9005669.1 hypothetical protein EDB86DRAFT_3240147 [Lactarius hatsudake]
MHACIALQPGPSPIPLYGIYACQSAEGNDTLTRLRPTGIRNKIANAAPEDRNLLEHDEALVTRVVRLGPDKSQKRETDCGWDGDRYYSKLPYLAWCSAVRCAKIAQGVDNNVPTEYERYQESEFTACQNSIVLARGISPTGLHLFTQTAPLPGSYDVETALAGPETEPKNYLSVPLLFRGEKSEGIHNGIACQSQFSIATEASCPVTVLEGRQQCYWGASTPM